MGRKEREGEGKQTAVIKPPPPKQPSTFQVISGVSHGMNKTDFKTLAPQFSSALNYQWYSTISSESWSVLISQAAATQISLGEVVKARCQVSRTD